MSRAARQQAASTLKKAGVHIIGGGRYARANRGRLQRLKLANVEKTVPYLVQYLLLHRLSRLVHHTMSSAAVCRPPWPIPYLTTLTDYPAFMPPLPCPCLAPQTTLAGTRVAACPPSSPSLPTLAASARKSSMTSTAPIPWRSSSSGRSTSGSWLRFSPVHTCPTHVSSFTPPAPVELHTCRSRHCHESVTAHDRLAGRVGAAFFTLSTH